MTRVADDMIHRRGTSLQMSNGGPLFAPRVSASVVALMVAALSFRCVTKLDPTVAARRDVPSSRANLDAGSECVDVPLGDKLFLVCGRPLAAFAAAQRDCQQRGGELARISSAEENAALLTASAQIETYTNFWIGATGDDEHVWRWPDDSIFWTGLGDGAATPGAFVNWQMGEPNDSSSVSGGPERCAAITLFGGMWRDRSCELELSYFCELAANGL